MRRILTAAMLAALLLAPASVRAEWPDEWTGGGASGPAGAPGAPGRPNWVDVTDFGATGTGSADDYAAIVAAIDSLGTHDCDYTSGGIVYMPGGAYLVSATLNIPACVLLKGEHRTTTTIRPGSTFPAATTPVITLCAETSTFGHGCAMEGITIDADDRADYAIQTDNANEGTFIRDFEINNGDVYGIFIKDPGGADPGSHKLLIENGEIYFTTPTAAQRGIRQEANTFGPADLIIRNVTINASSLVAGSIALVLNQPENYVEGLHVENMETAAYIVGSNTLLTMVHCGGVTTCIRILNPTATTVILNSRRDAGSTTTVQDDTYSVTIADEYVPFYAQYTRVGARMLVPRGATSVIVCAVANLGAIFYDTDARTSASPGTLCVCNPIAGVYQWHPLEPSVAGDTGVPIDLTGASTTNCGT